MSTPDDSSGPPKWLTEVKLADVTGCRATVERFISEPEAEVDAQFLKALPLFIMCGGDLACLAERIKKVTDSFWQEAKANQGSAEVPARVQKLCAQLTAISTGLSRLPESYKNDVSEVWKNVKQGVDACISDADHRAKRLTERRLENLRKVRPRKTILRKPTK